MRKTPSLPTCGGCDGEIVMLGRVLRPASAVRPTGELAAFLVFRIGRHRQSSWASRPIIVLALLLFCVFDPQITHKPVEVALDRSFWSRHLFQASTPCLSIATCSSFATEAPRLDSTPL